MKALLITFGCSWTEGVGCCYTKGMSNKTYKESAWSSTINDRLSFRGLLSQKYNLVNRTWATGGSSNQRQFRLAKEFFPSSDFKKLQSEFEKIIVLWGITSTARNELYLNSINSHNDIFYSHDTTESKIMTKYFYNHQHEVNQLLIEIRFWNNYFKSKNINNLWFDTFNHHEYHEISTFNDRFKIDYYCAAGPDWPSFDDYLIGNYDTSNQRIYNKILEIKNICLEQYKQPLFIHDKIKNLIFNEKNPRDLLSLLAIKNGQTQIDNNYHMSAFKADSNRIDYLINCDILNPFSHHPTQKGHEQIADLLGKHIEEIL
jgi:hypothetical protein